MTPRGEVGGELIDLDGTAAYRIDHVERMEPFLTTVVSADDLWMFVSSSGALTAGRIDADRAIFPYLTDDLIHRLVGRVGPVTVVARQTERGRELWRPFGARCSADCSRSLAKSVLGDELVFEEHHQGWDVTYRATWTSSPTYGWVRTSELVNGGQTDTEFEIVDGLLDVMPAGIDATTERTRSNLADAYKRSELLESGTAALFTLESLITDRAEPGEALAATLVWSDGPTAMQVLLDERAVAAVEEGRVPTAQALLTGRQGAYLLHGTVAVAVGDTTTWTIVADTGLGHAAVVDRLRDMARPDMAARLRADVEAGRERLRELLETADAFQRSADPIADVHHLSNSLFNAMRGGVFPYGYDIPVADLVDFIGVRNRACLARRRDTLDALGEQTTVPALLDLALGTDDDDLVRLALEYLPITFARRHGDPSRPWNRFSIRVRDEAGRDVLTYEGNWRDIFQNWEALLHSHPAFFPHVVAKFVNASTADGYNAYRISREGIDWEVPDPDDPWSNIGYWGDHQIIYLLRLLEAWERFAPGELDRWVTRPVFVYADVPYRLADHDGMVRSPQDTVTYDVQRAGEIARREAQLGTDGRLLVTSTGQLVRAGLLEKLVVPALAKLSAFVPGGGIWMNTQRPEWNDANNALAGTGLSVVTLAHLVRYLRFLRDLAARIDGPGVPVSTFVVGWMHQITELLAREAPVARDDDRRRRELIDALGTIGAEIRGRIHADPGDEVVELDLAAVTAFCDAALIHLHESLRDARQAGGLFHSYNRVSFPSSDEAVVHHLGPMLEGQVAALSAGVLEAREVIEVVDVLFESRMYRADQDSFMLYPIEARPGFLDRNAIGAAELELAPFLAAPDLGQPWSSVLVRDADGVLHFRPAVSDVEALRAVVADFDVDPTEQAAVEAMYEAQFDHASFTGRSGAMYGYEGIGSIYWHMVAKLMLAVQENHAAARDRGEPAEVVDALARAYRRIREGLGFRKPPQTYGAFPTDCYSHTPMGGGAKQPGMTGQVKEEILARLGEIGICIDAGAIRLERGLIDPVELFSATLDEPLTLSVCGVPIVVVPGSGPSVRTTWADGRIDDADGTRLPVTTSAEIFARSGAVTRIEFTIDRASLEATAD